MFREIEKAKRVETPLLDPERRTSGFEEIDRGLDDEPARREALRCLSCGCAKAGGCGLRRWATAYLADPYRFLGRRRFDRDASHPEVVYEPGKCVMCDACVRIAAAAGEELGLSIVGRGFDVSVAVPFGAPLSEGLRRVARQWLDDLEPREVLGDVANYRLEPAGSSAALLARRAKRGRNAECSPDSVARSRVIGGRGGASADTIAASTRPRAGGN